jgi:hypothetical protein
MVEKFEYYKFQATTNPFGIIFNPVSIEKLVNRIVNNIQFTEQDIFSHNDLWHCYEVHSQLSNPNKEDFLETLNALISSTNKQLTNSTHLIITYGTSWVYRTIESNKVVANCHKVPQKQFTKEILSIQTIEDSIQKNIELIQKVNPNCNIIFTVSPVRHIKDGFAENTLSKAHLISAFHSFLSHRAQSRCHYFPSYEILLDELRDYRFYAEDMLHPNQTAINYIWEKFNDVWMHPDTFTTMTLVDTIQKGLQHKPFNPQTKAHQAFLEDLEVKKLTLQNQFPHIVF